MKQFRTRRVLAGVLTGILAAGTAAVTVTPTAGAAGPSPRAYGLTADGSLVSFALRSPGKLRQIGKIQGVDGRKIVGIDIRPANNKLYAVSRGGGVFTINTATARATRVGRLDVALSGGHFGVDVNPAADALRIVSNNGQNLRHAFEGNVTTADTPLNVPDTTPRVRGVSAVAYTNNDNDDTTGTALYDINTTTDTVSLQIPANAGILTTQGPLRRTTSSRTGFDILSFRRNGATVSNVGWATLGGNKGYGIYRVNLTSGKATKVGDFKRLVVDLAVIH